MRPYWNNCLTHFDEDAAELIRAHFAEASGRRCLLIAAAGFDPRARAIAELLAGALGNRLNALLIREERGNPAANLLSAADANTKTLVRLIPSATVVNIDIFSDDDAPVGGTSILRALRTYQIPDGITDIALDLSAFSIGIGYPIARYLLNLCEARGNLNFHLMISSNPELDNRISSEPSDRVIDVKGYAGGALDPTMPLAQIWIPQLTRGRGSALEKVRTANPAIYKICPMLPFPAQNPRRADDLLTEYGTQLQAEWDVHARDLIYASERNPADCYRTISTLKERFYDTVKGIYQPQIILSPIGSKVMAAGSMMAAIEHNLTVQYVETLRYDFDPRAIANEDQDASIVHVWLHGSVYGSYNL